MKKVLLVLALVVAYGVSMSTASADVVTVDDAQITVVADVDENAPSAEKDMMKADVRSRFMNEISESNLDQAIDLYNEFLSRAVTPES